MPGTLFVVATPIGNLEDFTFRGLRTLREVDVIAAEDTRRTGKLLAHYEVRTPMVSLHEHNETREAPRLVARLIAGESIALVSDAGTPGISDPGATLVRLAREAGVSVVPIPGPSAVTAALSVSGLVGADGFTFAGFPPSSGPSRSEWFWRIAEDERPVVFFESPHRIARTISDLDKLLAQRQIIVFREITKEFEESIEQPKLIQLGAPAGSAEITDKGEFTVVIGPMRSDDAGDIPDAEVALKMIGQITECMEIDNDNAFVAVSALLGTTPAKVRKAIKKAKIAAKRAADQDS